MTIVDRPLLAPEQAPRIDVIGWILRLAVCGVFVAVGLSKFEAHSMWVALFARIGFGDWFRYFTGVLQVLGGVLFLIPKTRYVGTALVGMTMVGAVLAHLFVLGTGVPGAIIPFTLLLFVVVVAMRTGE
jgi:uncharacterized membrane protein YphA (DoxX/SURF4 family)